MFVRPHLGEINGSLNKFFNAAHFDPLSATAIRSKSGEYGIP